MELSEKEVQEFIECWKEDFGEILTREQAHSEGLRLLDFFATLEAEEGRQRTCDGKADINKP